MNRYLAVFVFLAAVPASASAQVLITEIMYDLAEGSDSGREWIEVQNVGTASIDLAEWRLFENNSNHKIAGAEKLAPGSYAIIADNVAKFRSDWPEFSGLVYESAFSLNNDGEAIAMRLGERASDSVVYDSSMGGDGSGDSLQRVEGSFMPGNPTPGEAIPEIGLMPAPPKEAAHQATVAAPVEVVGERRKAVPAAVAAATVNTAWQWWLGPFALAAVGSGGLVLFRQRRSEEWEIEEIE